MLKRRGELNAKVCLACPGKTSRGLTQSLQPPIVGGAAASWGLELQANRPDCATLWLHFLSTPAIGFACVMWSALVQA